MKYNTISYLFCLMGLLVSCSVIVSKNKKAEISSPIIKGYYADPTIVKHKNTFYIYATIDPWGAEELGVFETKDFKAFKQHHLDWPNKNKCISPTSNNSMVWAPSVRKSSNGKFYMYVAIGGEIWAGVSDHPLGPWQNLKPDHQPLIKSTDFPQVHNIDPDLFFDDDGSAYLYWGSGFDWVNGHCMGVKLKKDMISFDGKPKDITPPNFFEAAHMIKRNDQYYLMFSEGRAIDATYCVGYAVGNSPLGPWTEGKNSPILSTSKDSSTIGPGHHTVFNEHGQDFILYHKIHPQKEKYVLRQLYIDSLNFDSSGAIKKVVPRGVKSIFKS